MWRRPAPRRLVAVFEDDEGRGLIHLGEDSATELHGPTIVTHDVDLVADRNATTTTGSAGGPSSTLAIGVLFASARRFAPATQREPDTKARRGARRSGDGTMGRLNRPLTTERTRGWERR